jgi:hypothetical protein
MSEKLHRFTASEEPLDLRPALVEGSHGQIIRSVTEVLEGARYETPGIEVRERQSNLLDEEMPPDTSGTPGEMAQLLTHFLPDVCPNTLDDRPNTLLTFDRRRLVGARLASLLLVGGISWAGVREYKRREALGDIRNAHIDLARQEAEFSNLHNSFLKRRRLRKKVIAALAEDIRHELRTAIEWSWYDETADRRGHVYRLRDSIDTLRTTKWISRYAAFKLRRSLPKV